MVREKADPKGGPTTKAIGLSEKAVYTSSDGNVVLTGSPRVQQGLDTHVATSPDTIMILNQEGHLHNSRPQPDGDPAAEHARLHPRRELRRLPVHRLASQEKAMITSSAPTPIAGPVATPASLPNEHAEVLLTDDLVKIYGGRAVVNGIKLEVGQGEIVGLAWQKRRRQNNQLLHDRRTR